MVMAERRKGKKKKDIDPKDLEKKPTKEEYAIARYLKQKLPEKKTTLLGHKVEYFIASKAVDCLLESPWSKTKKGDIYFHNRDAAVKYMERMLDQKLFHRAKKIVVQKDSKKKKKDEEDVESSKEKETKKSKAKSETSEKKDDKEVKKEGETTNKKKEKKKIKLDMHLQQDFIDSNEPYVWIYDPIPMRTWITGFLMVIAAVLICLFPLWPQTIRHYIYYLSVAAAFFLVFIIGLAIFRLIFFVLVWIVTFGKHHIWILPNLTEDVGFFESFWPLYKYENKGKSKESEKNQESEDKKDKEDSKKEEEPPEKDGEKSDASSSDPEKEKKNTQNQSESEESGDDKQKVDNENGFEIIEADEANESKSEGDEEDRKTK